MLPIVTLVATFPANLRLQHPLTPHRCAKSEEGIRCLMLDTMCGSACS